MIATLAFAVQAVTALPTAPRTDPPPATTQLDILLTRPDYAALGQAVMNPATPGQARANLDWLRDRLLAGSSSYVSFLYAQALWSVSMRASPEGKLDLGDTAVMAVAYAYGAVGIDGARCADRTAPGHRQEQLLQLLPGFVAYVRAMPAERKAGIVRVALTIEQRTAARRDLAGDIGFVCRAGLDETAYDLAHGSTRKVPTSPGGIGRTVETRGDGKYEPIVRAAVQWRPAAAAARAALPRTLNTLLDMAN